MHHFLQVGKNVILYAMLRSNLAVAKGTIISTDPNSMLGGVALGKQYCEVIVNVVLKMDTILPQPYDGVELMADALNMPIAWPYQRVIHMFISFLSFMRLTKYSNYLNF